MAFLSQRCRRPEIMDQPDLEPRRHAEALHGLARLNFFSRSAGILWPPLADFARRMAPRPVRVLDLATASGDVPVRLCKRARRNGLDLRLEGCDVSPVAVAHADYRAEWNDHADVNFFVHDALSGPLPDGYDVIMCSLFLHHLDDEQAVDLLRRMKEAARLVLVNDLRRGLGGLLLAHLACRLLTRSDVVHVDGPRSVRAAFTIAEARTLAERAGLTGAVIRRRWPFRFLLTWERP
jgi:2-polyprenyl-3-methyl-5-hydroxy-6-metoxy-1,4-benzoquinol methylase